MRLLAMMVFSLGLAACQASTPQSTPDNSKSGSEKAEEARTKSPAGAKARPVTLRAAGEFYEVQVTYPAETAAIAPLLRQMQVEFAQARKDVQSAAAETKAMTETGSFIARECSDTQWWLVADTLRWFNLAGEGSWYSPGMAHPNSGFMTLLWDKKSGQVRKIEELFTSMSAVSALIRTEFCQAINREQVKRRGMPIGPKPEFSECLDPTNYIMVPGSSDGKSLNFVDVIVPAYEAGPYAEGDYHVRLPVTVALIRLIRPHFQADFAEFTDAQLLASRPKRGSLACE